MTDEQIVKALEYCVDTPPKCEECAYKDFFGLGCIRQKERDAIFLIRRQRAEIENLKQDVADLEETNGYLHAEFERRYGK